MTEVVALCGKTLELRSQIHKMLTDTASWN
jgi:hypothetical protein